MKHYVKVQRYADVEKMLDQLGNKETEDKEKTEKTESRAEELINQAKKEE